MNSFHSPLIVEVMPSGKKFKLHFDFTYYWERYGIVIKVPRSFVTDFASIPQPFHAFIPKLGRYNKAAVLHDAVYQHFFLIINKQKKPFYFTRKLADLLFLDAMRDLGVSERKRKIMYLGVRWFGWLSWRRKK